MVKTLLRLQQRLLIVAALVSAGLTIVSQSPAAALVTTVSGSACGFYTNVGLFGGPEQLEGCGQSGVTPTSSSYSPQVSLPAGGSATAVTASDPDGATGQYGPAKIFSGQYPNAANDPSKSQTSPPSGPLDVSTQGTAAGGSVTSSASVSPGTQGTVDPTQPRGIGPGPVIADAVSSTCTASESGVTGSTSMTNGIVVLTTDSNGDPLTTEPVPANPPVNYTRSGTINNVGDHFTVVYNEQVVTADSITVNAVHMYLLGPIARGDMVVAQSKCQITSTTPNNAPVAGNDAYSAKSGRPVTVAAPGLLANDSDPDGNALTAQSATPVFVPGPSYPSQTTDDTYNFPSDPAHGSVTINANGSFTYQSDPGFAGTDTFTYVVRDARGANATGTVTITVAAALPPVADFDGNGSTDLSVFRPSQGVWYIQGQPAVAYGSQGDIPVAGDYDGDGKADVAVFRPSNGVWYIHLSGGGDQTIAYGAQGDRPVPGDYDGDGKTDIAVFRPSNGVWYIHQSGGTDTTVAWGTNGDVPVVGDYNGDHKADVAVFRPSNGVWYVQGGTTVAWGAPSDIPAPGDYNGDGTTDIAVFRPSNGVWYVQGGTPVAFGTQGDVPAPGDYNADGTTDIAVFRPSNGVWYVSGGTVAAWGAQGDVPLPVAPAIFQSI